MAVTVEQLAKQVGNVPVDRLLQQLQRAGVAVSKASDTVNDTQKAQLLEWLQSESSTTTAATSSKISLKRRQVMQVRRENASGTTSTVSVVRKTRRVYSKDEQKEAAPVALTVEPTLPPAGTATEATTCVVEKDAVVAAHAPEASATAPAPEAAAVVTGRPAVPATPSKTVSLKKNSPVKSKGKTEGTPSTAHARGKENADEHRRNRFSERKAKHLPLSLNEDGEIDIVERYRGKKSKQREEDEQDPGYNPHAFAKPVAPIVHEIKIPEFITVAELAQKLSLKAAALIKQLIDMGVMATINQSLDQDTACLLVEELGHKAVPYQDVSVEESMQVVYAPNTAKPRAPIVTVMGHVDHGKTSLLDYIRQEKVAAGEAGGITQHIGAYQVETARGRITFIDTPGHESFTAMRARGAHCTDIVILVVAADDGVMPQTVEAIQHAKAAAVPIIVAINKIDKADADRDRVIQALSQHGLMPEEWGGETIFRAVSAHTGEGIDALLEAVMLQAELLELTAPMQGPAQGIVLEAYLDKGRGPVATVLIAKGALQRQDIVLAGLEYGRVKMMYDASGNSVTVALPAMPVQILGLSGVPRAGDSFQVLENESKAREVALYRQTKQREQRLSKQRACKLKGMMERFEQGSEHQAIENFNVVLKADVHGSLEALTNALEKISVLGFAVQVISSGVGGFNESDINLAIASQAMLIGFNVRANAMARELAHKEGVELYYFSIIYDVIDKVTALLTGKLAPKRVEKILGLAEVRSVFRSSKWGAIAGCMVIDGVIRRGYPIRVLRNDVVIYEGELESLRRFQDDVGEVRKGIECGIGVKNYNDVRERDQIEVFEITTEPA
jgi:translation initiation factor IF-2